MEKSWLEATQAGDCEVVAVLLDAGADINALDRYGQTALINATYQGDIELVKLLVAKGAELNHTAKYNLTALMLAVINNHAEIVRVLVAAGANAQIEGSRGTFACTPLEYAIKNGNDAIAQILRENA